MGCVKFEKMIWTGLWFKPLTHPKTESMSTHLFNNIDYTYTSYLLGLSWLFNDNIIYTFSQRKLNKHQLWMWWISFHQFFTGHCTIQWLQIVLVGPFQQCLQPNGKVIMSKLNTVSKGKWPSMSNKNCIYVPCACIIMQFSLLTFSLFH